MTDGVDWKNLKDETFVLKNFEFENGQSPAELNIHYLTLGTPKKNANGAITNAVLLIHNTTGSAQSWLGPGLGGELFNAGQALDLDKYFLIIPDAIGFGKSSKPSDGLKANFPNYRYIDIVKSIHQLLTDDLGIDHLHLLLGISMGGMLAWMWAEMYPDFIDAVVPIACQPGPMSGRNWMQRRIAIEAIRNDPEWLDGDYEKNPTRYVVTAPFSALLTQSVVHIQERAPTREAADAFYRELVERAKTGDANNRLYQIEASMDYDPSHDLDKIKARLFLINFADDELNPPALDVVEPAIARIPGASYVLVPASGETRGHFSNLMAAIWKSHLEEFMSTLGT